MASDTVDKDDILFVLTAGDIEFPYDERCGQGSFRALSSDKMKALKYRVRKNLEYGLGEVWADYMVESVDLAIKEDA